MPASQGLKCVVTVRVSVHACVYVHVVCSVSSFVGSLLLNESRSRLLADTCDVAHLVLERDSVELVRTLQQLGTECGGDELSILCQTVDHGCMLWCMQFP